MSMDLSKLEEDPAKIDRKFLYYKLMTDPVRRFMKDHASGSTVLHLQTRAVPSLELDYPAYIPEQAKIGEILTTIDRAIQQTEAIIAKQQRIKTGLMQDLLTKGIDKHGNIRSEATHTFKNSPLGRIPVEWNVNSLEELSSYIVDCPHTTPHFSLDGVLVIRTFNIKDGQFIGDPYFVLENEYRDRVSRLIPEFRDVVFTREAPVGEAFIIPAGMRICLGQRTMLIRLAAEKLEPEYFVDLVYSEEMRIRFDQMVAGTTNPHLNVADVRRLTIKTPPLCEQIMISKNISSISTAMKITHESKEKLQAMKQGLMSDLFSGKVRITDPLAQTPTQ